MTVIAKLPDQAQQDAEAAFDAEVDDVIAACGGDMHIAVRALVRLAFEQERRLAELRSAVSHGLGRGRFAR